MNLDIQLDPNEARVFGVLVEKALTTPEQYPLTLNALRLACNQATNRDPVVDYDEATIRVALERLSRRHWVRLASGQTSRVAKYRHLFDEALQLDGSQTALLAVLMLRGQQTVGELRQRTERLYHFGSLAEIEQKLAGLAERELAVRLPRRPGEREERWTQLLGSDVSTLPAPGEPVRVEAALVEAARVEPPRSDRPSLEERVDRIESRLAELLEALERAGLL